MKKELQAAREIALGAGAILLDHFSRPARVDWKGPNDPVTTADRAASAYIVAELQRLFPADGILSEEAPDDQSRLGRRRVWLVDPMDGTSEYIARRSEFAVMIGMVLDGVPVVGVVYQPVTRKLYFAAAGNGAFLQQNGDPRRLYVSPERTASRMVIALSRSHSSSRVDHIRERLRIQKSVRTGSVGLKVGLICEGEAHLYVHTGNRTKTWDTCGPEAILREAGGRMTDARNAPLQYTSREVRNLHGVVATNGIAHDRIVKVTQSVVLGDA